MHKVKNFSYRYQVVIFFVVAHEIVLHVRHLGGLPWSYPGTVGSPACAVFCSDGEVGWRDATARSASKDGAVGSPQKHAGLRSSGRRMHGMVEGTWVIKCINGSIGGASTVIFQILFFFFYCNDIDD